MDKKLCTKCKVEKEVETFTLLRTGKYCSWCRPCMAINTSAYRNGSKAATSKDEKVAKRAQARKEASQKDYRVDPDELFRAQMEELIESNRGYV